MPDNTVQGVPDIVIPSRATPAPWLGHAAVAQHTMIGGHVWIVGAQPDWARNLDWVTTVPLAQSNRIADAWHNVGHILRWVLDNDAIGQRFVWSADDVFPLRPHTPGVYARTQPLDWYVDRIVATRNGNATYHNEYVRGVVAQRDLLRREGHDTATYPNLCCHMPLLADKTLLEVDMARLATIPRHPLGAFKAAHTPAVEPVRIPDPKLRNAEHVLPDRDVVSLASQTWTRRRQIAKVLARRFPL